MKKSMEVIVNAFKDAIFIVSFIGCSSITANVPTNNSSCYQGSCFIRDFYYKPTVDFAQYAVHQGDARSANLVEGFIPLGKWSFDHILFADLRYYNPNGTPVEWNGDLGFRQLYRDNFLFGIYGGYDRFRSNTSRYFSQVNGGG